MARRDATSNTIIYYFSDHLGSTAITVGTGGTRKDEYDFAPYGYQIVTVADTVPQNYKFNGKERDSESGLDEFGARYYSGTMGRFMQTDWAAKPVSVPYANFGNPQSLNLYSYVQNNPTTFGDPDGHQCLGKTNEVCKGDGNRNDNNKVTTAAGAQNQTQTQTQGNQQTPAPQPAPKPTVQPGPAPTDPATGKPSPPPIPAPVDVNGKPTNWKPIPGSGPIPGNRWVPDGKVPSPDGKGGTPAVVWDPHDGYWTHDDGGGNRTHWGTNGVQVVKQVTFWGTVTAIGYQIIQALGEAGVE
jgi:RHS repeat-associated protein